MKSEFIKPLVTIELAEYEALQKYIGVLEGTSPHSGVYREALTDIIILLVEQGVLNNNSVDRMTVDRLMRTAPNFPSSGTHVTQNVIDTIRDILLRNKLIFTNEGGKMKITIEK